jgi:hypothetical protein
MCILFRGDRIPKSENCILSYKEICYYIMTDSRTNSHLAFGVLKNENIKTRVC